MHMVVRKQNGEVSDSLFEHATLHDAVSYVTITTRSALYYYAPHGGKVTTLCTSLCTKVKKTKLRAILDCFTAQIQVDPQDNRAHHHQLVRVV